MTLRIVLDHGRLDLLVIQETRPSCGESEPSVLCLSAVLRRLKRQIQHRKSEHHLREIATRLGDIRRNKSALRPCGHPGCVVAPERIHGDEFGVLFGDAQLVVVVLRPLLRGTEGAEEDTDFLADFRGVCLSEIEDSAIDDRPSAVTVGSTQCPGT